MQYCTTVSEFEGQNPLPRKACHAEVATRTLLWAPLHPAQNLLQRVLSKYIHVKELLKKARGMSQALGLKSFACFSAHKPAISYHGNGDSWGQQELAEVRRRQNYPSAQDWIVPPKNSVTSTSWYSHLPLWSVGRISSSLATSPFWAPPHPIPSQRLTFGFASIFQETLPQPKWPGTKRSLCPRMSKV